MKLVKTALAPDSFSTVRDIHWVIRDKINHYFTMSYMHVFRVKRMVKDETR